MVAAGTGERTGTKQILGAETAAWETDEMLGGRGRLLGDSGGTVRDPEQRSWTLQVHRGRGSGETVELSTEGGAERARPPETGEESGEQTQHTARLWPRLSAGLSSHTVDAGEPSEQGQGPEGHAPTRSQGISPQSASEALPGSQSGASRSTRGRHSLSLALPKGFCRMRGEGHSVYARRKVHNAE